MKSPEIERIEFILDGLSRSKDVLRVENIDLSRMPSNDRTIASLLLWNLDSAVSHSELTYYVLLAILKELEKIESKNDEMLFYLSKISTRLMMMQHGIPNNPAKDQSKD